MDIVEQMRGFEIDHEPEGWPGVRMRQVSALCDEIERLRAVIKEASEAAEILDNISSSVEKHGNYSKDATLLFLSHARSCLNCLTPNA